MENKTSKVLTREEFDEDMKTQRECYECLSQYSDFEMWKHYFSFEIISYEQYLERYAKFYVDEQEDENDKKNIVINSIEE